MINETKLIKTLKDRIKVFEDTFGGRVPVDSPTYTIISTLREVIYAVKVSSHDAKDNDT